MYRYCLLLALLAAPACLADGQRWYVVNKDGGCAVLAEGHDQLAGLAGSWTPEDLLKVMREQYPDAKLAPLADARDRRKPAKAADTKAADAKDAAGKDAAAKDDGRRKFFTPANALLLSANDGHVEITLYDWALCSKLGALPPGPEQWLAALEPPADVLGDGSEVARSSWFEVTDERLTDAVGSLKDNAFAGIGESWAVYIADRRYMPEPDKHSYLVRGVGTGRAGTHRLLLRDGVLYVIYRTVAAEDTLRYAPLVVNLPEAPASVVVLLQTARP